MKATINDAGKKTRLNRKKARKLWPLRAATRRWGQPGLRLRTRTLARLRFLTRRGRRRALLVLLRLKLDAVRLDELEYDPEVAARKRQQIGAYATIAERCGRSRTEMALQFALARREGG